MSEWQPAQVVQNEQVVPGLHRLSLRVEPRLAEAFHTPGQYHRVRVPNGKEGIFAIASAPGATPFEYLVRSTPGAAESLLGTKPGDVVEVQTPEGPGFPLTKAKGSPVLAIGMGTGFAPLRSVLLAIRRDRGSFGPVHGLYGVNSPPQLAWTQEWKEWSKDSILITPTVTTPDASWKGAVGRVQQHLHTLPLDGAIAFVVGHADMVADVTTRLEERGLPRARVFQNLPVG